MEELPPCSASALRFSPPAHDNFNSGRPESLAAAADAEGDGSEAAKKELQLSIQLASAVGFHRGRFIGASRDAIRHYGLGGRRCERHNLRVAFFDCLGRVQATILDRICDLRHRLLRS